jgi:PBP1b-binding outer membrane lipoprotein LpoB
MYKKIYLMSVIFAATLVLSGCSAEQQSSATEATPTEAEEYNQNESEGWNPSTDPSWEQYNL